MFDINNGLLVAGFSGAALTAAGVAVPSIPPELILFVISVAGSCAAVGYRFLSGGLRDIWSGALAVFSGILLAYVAIPWINKFFDVEGLESGVFVLILSLFGARVVKFLANDFDVARFLDGILSRFTKNQN